MQKKKNFNFKNFLVNRKNMGLAILLGLVAFFLVFLAIIPQFNKFLELTREFKLEKPKLEQLNKKLLGLENISFTPEFAQANVVEQALPSKKPLLEFLASLNAIATQDQVQIENFSLNPGVISSNSAELHEEYKKKNNKSGVDTLDVSMNVVGSFKNIQEFLIDLEKISPFTTINTLSLNSRKRGDDFNSKESDMQADLTTKSYFFTQTVASAVTAPLPVLNTREQEVLKELATFSNSDLSEQLEVEGGGLEDLFGVNQLEFED